MPNTRIVAGLRVESRTYQKFEHLQRITVTLVKRHKLHRIDVETANEMLHYEQQNAHRFNVSVATNAIPNLRLSLATSMAQMEDEMFGLMELTKEMREFK